MDNDDAGDGNANVDAVGNMCGGTVAVAVGKLSPPSSSNHKTVTGDEGIEKSTRKAPKVNFALYICSLEFHFFCFKLIRRQSVRTAHRCSRESESERPRVKGANIYKDKQ